MRSLRFTTILFLTYLAGPVWAANCTVSTTGVALGSYTSNQAMPADATARITVTCEKSALDSLPMTVNYSLEISRGGSASFSPRGMNSGVNAINYNLYCEASHSSVCGDATGGTVTVTGSLLLQLPAGNASTTHSLYGRIFAAQNVYPGTYADSLVVTLNY